jgi:hypothetical protein
MGRASQLVVTALVVFAGDLVAATVAIVVPLQLVLLWYWLLVRVLLWYWLLVGIVDARMPRLLHFWTKAQQFATGQS